MLRTFYAGDRPIYGQRFGSHLLLIFTIRFSSEPPFLQEMSLLFQNGGTDSTLPIPCA